MSQDETNQVKQLVLDKSNLRTIIDSVPNGILMVNQSGHIVLANKQIETLFKYKSSDLIGQPIEILVPHKSRSAHPQFRDSFFKESKARLTGSGRDLLGLRQDGSTFPVEIGLNPIESNGQKYVLASIVDVTERKRIEEKLSLVVEASPSGLLMIDHVGQIVLINSQAERLFGYSREEIIGQTIEILVPKSAKSAHPEHRDKYFKNPEARAMGTGRDLFGLHKSGYRIPVEIGLNPLMSDGERFVLASVVDITKRKEAEELLQEKLIDLERSNEDLQQFAYVCSHDLQEPLRVISNYTQLISRRYSGTLDQNADDFIEFITDATKRMQNLINDLLRYSRVQTKGQEFSATDCNAILEKVCANLKVSIMENNAQINYKCLPVVKGDRSQILQLFQNIIANAIKFRSDSQPIINIRATETREFWQFEINDNGLGFDMKYKDRVLVIFQRLHTKEEYPGSGIGLAICKKIVERHGGILSIQSQLGHGTTLHFTLPKINSTQGDDDE